MVEQFTLRKKKPLPANLASKLREAPDLLPGMDLYLEAWNDLTTTRSIGFSVGPIPWNTCQAWCGVRNYDLRTQQDVWEVIRRVDISMLEHWREVAEKQSKKGRS